MIVTVDPGSPVPPYEQVRDQIVAGIGSGVLPAGARLPTVRQLAGDLGLAINTVAKAYKQLEAEGHVATRGRNGTVVLPRRSRTPGQGTPGSGEAGPSATAGRPAPGDEAYAAAVVLARAAQRHGLDLNEAVGLLRQAW